MESMPIQESDFCRELQETNTGYLKSLFDASASNPNSLSDGLDPRNRGKGHLFPDSWNGNDINSLVQNIGNIKHFPLPSIYTGQEIDECKLGSIVNGKQSYILERQNVNGIIVQVYTSGNEIKSALPPGTAGKNSYPNIVPIDYYIDRDTLVMYITNVPSNYTP